jgi:hypothetical protein
MTAEKTNLTELNYLFEGEKRAPVVSIRLIADRFRFPGDTTEQSLARQQASSDRIAAKLQAKQQSRSGK